MAGSLLVLLNLSGRNSPGLSEVRHLDAIFNTLSLHRSQIPSEVNRLDMILTRSKNMMLQY